MVHVLVPVYPHLVAYSAPGSPVSGPGPGPHVAEAPGRHGRHTAEVRGSNAAVEVTVI